MTNDLVAIEHLFQPVAPKFEDVLAATGMSFPKFMQGILVSCERNTALLDPEKCSRQSLLNAAISLAFLGLDVDGYTGQGFIIPFGGRGQAVVGYKGYNSMAARSGFTINAASIHEGDDYDFDLGRQFIHHKPKLGSRGRIIGAWALATSNNQPPIGPIVMGIDDLMAVKAKSPGAKKKESPWNDYNPEKGLGIGFQAMCEKTCKRRLARGMPLNTMVLAAAMDETYEERGLHAHIDPDKGRLVVPEESPLPKREPATSQKKLTVTDQPDLFEVTLDTGKRHRFTKDSEFLGYLKEGISTARDLGVLEARMAANEARLKTLRGAGYESLVDDVYAAATNRRDKLRAAT